MAGFFDHELALISEAEPVRMSGSVARVVGLVIEAKGISVPVGSLCRVDPSLGGHSIEAEVVGFRDDRAILMPYGTMQGLKRFDRVVHLTSSQMIDVGPDLLGRVIDSRGRVVDGGPPPRRLRRVPLYAAAPKPLARARISDPLSTGVRVVDGLITCGRGQRIGLFSGSGVGKSILMGMMTRYTEAPIVVVALVGERGREVRDFLEKDLGPEGRKRAVVVVSTGDEPPLMRVKAPFAATAVAEYFRDEGHDVLLMMDSVTRMAFAQREIGLSAGEPPATKGYPPSVFALMPRLMERAGRSDKGSITGIYTVLVEGDDVTEPIADAARSILDGHIWLSRELAQRGHFPAVDPLQSVSRVMIDVVAREHLRAATRLKALLATHKSAEDLISIGAYVAGSNVEIDRAIRMLPAVNGILRQEIGDHGRWPDTVAAILELAKMADEK